MDALNRHRKSSFGSPRILVAVSWSNPVLTRSSRLSPPVKSEGGVDCARLQGLDDGSNGMAGAGLPPVKMDDSVGWPTLGGRSIGALAM